MAVSNIVSLFRARPENRDWSNQELAEFYRVESALISVGFHVDTERGLSDEGEPWFVFIDGLSDDVIVHCARIDGAYVIASAAFDSVLRGPDFRSLVETFLERHPLVLPPADTPEKKSNIRLHPAAFLVALVATAFFKLSTNDASASELDDDGGPDGTRLPETDTTSLQLNSELDKRQTMAVLAAIAVVTTQLRGDVDIAASEQQDSRLLTTAEMDQNGRDHDNATFSASTAGHEGRGNALTGEVIVSGFQDGMPSTYNALQAGGGTVFPDLMSARQTLAEMVGEDESLSSLFFTSGKEVSTPDNSQGISLHVHHEGIGSGDSATGEIQARLTQIHLAASTDEAAGGSMPHGQSFIAEADGRHGISTISLTSNHISFEVDPNSNIRDKLPGALSPNQPAAPVLPEPQEEEEQAAAPPVESGRDIDIASILSAAAPYLKVSTKRIQHSDEAYAYDDNARQTINNFVRNDTNSTTITHGSDVILIDSNLARYGNSEISFVTWSFDDGSTISLIGVFDYDHAA